MVIGMATSKITVTLETEQIEEVRALVAAGRVANVSAFVKHAVKIALSDVKGWSEMLKEGLEQTGGPLTKEEREWAEGILRGPSVRAGRGKGKRKAA